jgi:prolyl oligopeptidase PreP (S9A serine peptidase family)
MLREPLLYDAMVTYNSITDLTNYIFEKSYKSSLSKISLMEEFGNIEDKEIYEILKLMNPYQIPFYPNYRYQTDLLMTYDHDRKDEEIHTRKFIAKMREINKNNDFMFIRKFGPTEQSPILKSSIHYSFLALSLLFRVRRDSHYHQKSADIEKQLRQLDIELKNKRFSE